RVAPCQWMRIIGSRGFCARAFLIKIIVRSKFILTVFLYACFDPDSGFRVAAPYNKHIKYN
ncbi:hypothetical protein LL240_14915, partial [Oceanimonas baumannii]|uniref:hypothetical protein n=1 Tax=Oceanimonas baumannii TaxID=129578 RepID=UPI001D17F911